MAFTRSKSTSYVHSDPYSPAGLTPVTPGSITGYSSHGSRGRIARPGSSFELTSVRPLDSRASSPPHTQRTEQPESPFNLDGFFPSHVGFPGGNKDESWDWLHGSERHPTSYEHAGPSSPSTENDDEWPRTPCTELDEGATRDLIKREDKLGVLSLATLHDSSGGSYSDSRLLSPYSEENVMSDDALYDSWQQRRLRHSSVPRTGDKSKVAAVPLSALFAPGETEGEKEEPESDGWDTAIIRGVRRVVDYLGGF